MMPKVWPSNAVVGESAELSTGPTPTTVGKYSSSIDQFPGSHYKGGRHRIKINENPFEFSNRQLGTTIVGCVEIGFAAIYIALTLLSVQIPGFVDPESGRMFEATGFLPFRLRGEIGVMFFRSVLTAAGGVLLIFGAKRRCRGHCNVYILLTVYLLSFHYAYVILMALEDVSVTLWCLPEVFPRILVFWTVLEFHKELKYYETQK